MILQSELLLHWKRKEYHVQNGSALLSDAFQVEMSHHDELFSLPNVHFLSGCVSHPHLLVHSQSAFSAIASAECFLPHSLPKRGLVCSPA